jgi:hypothetical protein
MWWESFFRYITKSRLAGSWSLCVPSNTRLFLGGLSSSLLPPAAYEAFNTPYPQSVFHLSCVHISEALAILRAYLASGLSASGLVTPRLTWTPCFLESWSPCLCCPGTELQPWLGILEPSRGLCSSQEVKEVRCHFLKPSQVAWEFSTIEESLREL